jgi:hypothetical protein
MINSTIFNSQNLDDLIVKNTELIWEKQIKNTLNYEQLKCNQQEIRKILFSDDYMKSIDENSSLFSNEENKIYKKRAYREIFQEKYNFNSHSSKYLNRLLNRLNSFSKKINGATYNFNQLNQQLPLSSNSDERLLIWRGISELSTQNKEDAINWVKESKSFVRNETHYKSIIDFILDENELDVEKLSKWVDEIEINTRDIYKRALNKKMKEFNLDKIYPWDIPFLMNQRISLPKRIENLSLDDHIDNISKFSNKKIDNSSIEITVSDQIMIPKCFYMDQEKVKIILGKLKGQQSYLSLYHELGHAFLHTVKRSDQRLLQHVPTAYSEGIAQTFSYLFEDKSYLCDFLKISEMEYKKYREDIFFDRLVKVRSLIGYIKFELWLYSVADYENIDQIENEFQKNSLLVDDGEEILPRWACNPYLFQSIFSYKYLIADMIAAMFHKLDLPETLELITSYEFCLNWQSNIEKLCNEPINTKSLVDRLVNMY